MNSRSIAGVSHSTLSHSLNELTDAGAPLIRTCRRSGADAWVPVPMSVSPSVAATAQPPSEPAVIGVEPEAAVAPAPEPEATVAVEPEPEAEATVAVEPEAAAAKPAAETEDDLEGARLIALNMALNGNSREDIDRYLQENFDLTNRKALLDEVYASVEG